MFDGGAVCPSQVPLEPTPAGQQPPGGAAGPSPWCVFRGSDARLPVGECRERWVMARGKAAGGLVSAGCCLVVHTGCCLNTAYTFFRSPSLSHVHNVPHLCDPKFVLLVSNGSWFLNCSLCIPATFHCCFLGWFFFFLLSICANKAGQTVSHRGMFLTAARHQLCQGMKRCLSVGTCAMTLFNLQSSKLLSSSEIAKLKIIKIQMTWW